MLGWRVVSAVTAVSLSAAALTVLSGPSAAQSGASEEPDESALEIVVTGYQDIVVNGRAIHCRPAAGDPLDDVRIGGGWGDHMMIVPDGEGAFAAKRVTELITGPEFWQRVGVGMGAYHYRAPSGDRPMCIGGRGGANSFGGYRRIVDAAPYRGQRVRFTAWVATGRAEQVNFWLAAGSEWPEERRQFEVRRTPAYGLLNGGNTNGMRFGGDRGWTPVLIETGPIHRDASHISYGFNLEGSGDVWAYDPRLEIVAQPENERARELVVMIGREQE